MPRRVPASHPLPIMPLILSLSLFLSLAGCASLEGSLALHQGRYGEAIDRFQEHLDEFPGDLLVREKLAYACFKDGRTDQAIEEFEAVRAQAPSRPLTTVCLGIAYLRKADMASAMAVWREVDAAKAPLVAAEIERVMTLARMAEGRRLARLALADEAALRAAVGAAGASDTYAVLTFDGHDHETLRPMGKALAAMTATDLAAIGSIRVVERTRMQALLDEMALGQSGAVDEAGAPRVGRLLGAERLVAGALSAPGGRLRVSGATGSAGRDAVLTAFSLSGPMDRFFEVQKEMVYRIVTDNDIELADAERERLAAYHTTSLEAVTLYGRGLDALDQGRWQEAHDFFSRATAVDPAFGLAVEARESSPTGAAVGLDALDGLAAGKAAAAAAVAGSVESMLTAATTAQNAADASADSDGGDGGGGGGGGGGGH